jgi:hypothetical protein
MYDSARPRRPIEATAPSRQILDMDAREDRPGLSMRLAVPARSASNTLRPGTVDAREAEDVDRRAAVATSEPSLSAATRRRPRSPVGSSRAVSSTQPPRRSP